MKAFIKGWNNSVLSEKVTFVTCLVVGNIVATTWVGIMTSSIAAQVFIGIVYSTALYATMEE